MRPPRPDLRPWKPYPAFRGKIDPKPTKSPQKSQPKRLNNRVSKIIPIWKHNSERKTVNIFWNCWNQHWDGECDKEDAATARKCDQINWGSQDGKTRQPAGFW